MDAAIDKLLGQSLQPSAIETAHGWYRLPGGRIELRGTGFHIQLFGRDSAVPYRLYDPEGRELCYGFDLQPMKQLAERFASDRAEFGQ